MILQLPEDERAAKRALAYLETQNVHAEEVACLLYTSNGSRVTTAFIAQNMRSSQTAYCYTYRKAYAEGGTAMPPKGLRLR